MSSDEKDLRDRWTNQELQNRKENKKTDLEPLVTKVEQKTDVIEEKKEKSPSCQNNGTVSSTSKVPSNGVLDLEDYHKNMKKDDSSFFDNYGIPIVLGVAAVGALFLGKILLKKN